MTASIILNLMDVAPPVPGQTYWLIELVGKLEYYTSPSYWSDSVDLATKYHTQAAAQAEAAAITGPSGEAVLVTSHVWT